MGILVQDNGKRSKLQDQITSDLRQKNQSTGTAKKDVDLVEDSAYAKNLKSTGRFGWFWFVLIALAVVSIVVILMI